MSDEQAVVEETDVQPKEAETEETGAQKPDEYETLLTEFEEAVAEETKSFTTEPVAAGDEKPKRDLSEEIENVVKAKLDEERAREAAKRDLENVVKTIRGDNPDDRFDDVFVTAWVDSQAQKDPRLQNAWLKRHEKPDEFKRIVAKLAEQFQSKISHLPDKNTTEDRDAVNAAVRGSSNTGPGDQELSFADLARMHPLEKEKYVRELSARYKGSRRAS